MKKITRENQEKNIIRAGVYLVFAILIIFTLLSKMNFHVDEFYTYSLSNNLFRSSLYEEGIKYEPADQAFKGFLTADESGRFDYSNVWKNQGDDVHPPLYYALVHTVCSFFPGSFSIFFSGVINIIFALLTLFFVRKLLLLLLENKLVRELLSVGFVLSAGILSATSFLRMYIMAMFFVTWISYLVIDSIGKEDSWKFYVTIFTSVLLASLTHFYCIVYIAFLSITYGLYLLLIKKWKRFGIYCTTIMMSVGLSCVIFPNLLNSMFFSYRGKEAINNLVQKSDFLERIVNFFGFLNQQMFGNCLSYILLAACFGLVYVMLSKREQKTSNLDITISEQESKIENRFKISQTNMKYLLLIIPSFLYFLLVTKMAAYQTDRYLFPIYAVTFVWVLSLVCFLASKILTKRVFAAFVCITLSIITIGSLQESKWPYLYQSTRDLLVKASCYSDVDCICIYDVEWKTPPIYCEASNYKSITFVEQDHLDKLPTNNIQSEKEIIVILVGIQNKEIMLEQILENYPALAKYEEIGSFAYGSSYHLF